MGFSTVFNGVQLFLQWFSTVFDGLPMGFSLVFHWFSHLVSIEAVGI